MLIVDVQGSNGAPISTLVLNYTVDAVEPTATVVPVDEATIIGSEYIVILFSEEMEPDTLRLTGGMAAESNGGIWSTTSNINDTLVIRPTTVWSGSVDTLIVDVDSVAGVSLSTLTLVYSVDVSVPIAITVPAEVRYVLGLDDIQDHPDKPSGFMKRTARWLNQFFRQLFAPKISPNPRLEKVVEYLESLMEVDNDAGNR